MPWMPSGTHSSIRGNPDRHLTTPKQYIAPVGAASNTSSVLASQIGIHLTSASLFAVDLYYYFWAGLWVTKTGGLVSPTSHYESQST